jgi:hypothetical protein
MVKPFPGNDLYAKENALVELKIIFPTLPRRHSTTSKQR